MLMTKIQFSWNSQKGWPRKALLAFLENINLICGKDQQVYAPEIHPGIPA